MSGRQKAESLHAASAWTCDVPVIGTVRIVERGESIIRLDIGSKAPFEPLTNAVTQETPLLMRAFDQLCGYLARTRKEFDLPLNPEGTPFQRKVWEALRNIPYGQTRSYQQVAEAVGCPKGGQAVGGANNRNPIAIFIPCHRVIGADGSMVGYGGGLEIKENLLRVEGCKLTQTLKGCKLVKNS